MNSTDLKKLIDAIVNNYGYVHNPSVNKNIPAYALADADVLTCEASPASEITPVNIPVVPAAVNSTKRKTGPKTGSNSRREWIYSAIRSGALKADENGNVFIKKDGMWTTAQTAQQGKKKYDTDGNCIGHTGYVSFTLVWNGRRDSVYVHEVVWMYQNGLIPYGKTLDHIRPDKFDNSLSNLQLMTLEENQRKFSRPGQSVHFDKLRAERKEIIDLMASGHTVREISKITGLTTDAIYSRLKTARKNGEY